MSNQPQNLNGASFKGMNADWNNRFVTRTPYEFLSSSGNDAFAGSMEQRGAASKDDNKPEDGLSMNDSFLNSHQETLIGGDLMKGIMNDESDKNRTKDAFLGAGGGGGGGGGGGIGWNPLIGSSLDTLGGNNSSSLWKNDGSARPKTCDVQNNSFQPFANNEGLGFLRRSASTEWNESHKSSSVGSRIESPSTVGGDKLPPAVQSSVASSQEIPQIPPGLPSLPMSEKEELIASRINSNEGWGQRPINQKTPWVLDGQNGSGRVSETSEIITAVKDDTAVPTPAPRANLSSAKDMSGPYWDQNSKILNSTEFDGNIGVWNGPPSCQPQPPDSGILSGLSSVREGKPNWSSKSGLDPHANLLDQVAKKLASVSTNADDGWKSQHWDGQPQPVPGAIGSAMGGWDGRMSRQGPQTPLPVGTWDQSNMGGNFENPSNPQNALLMQQLQTMGISKDMMKMMDPTSPDIFSGGNKQGNQFSYQDQQQRGRPLLGQSLAPGPSFDGNSNSAFGLGNSFSSNFPPRQQGFGHQQPPQNYFMTPRFPVQNNIPPQNSAGAMPSASQLQQVLMALQQQQQQQQQQQSANKFNRPGNPPQRNHMFDNVGPDMHRQQRLDDHSMGFTMPPPPQQPSGMNLNPNSFQDIMKTLYGTPDGDLLLQQMLKADQENSSRGSRQSAFEDMSKRPSLSVDTSNFWGPGGSGRDGLGNPAGAEWRGAQDLFQTNSQWGNESGGSGLLSTNAPPPGMLPDLLNRNSQWQSRDLNSGLNASNGSPFNWVLIKNFPADMRTLQAFLLDCSQRSSTQQYVLQQFSLVLVCFRTTEEAMKLKASCTMQNMTSELLRTDMANQMLQSNSPGVWTPIQTSSAPRFGPWDSMH